MTEIIDMKIIRLICRRTLMVAFISSAGGCTIHTDNWGMGLSGMTQERARTECELQPSYTEYRECVAKVNILYDNWRFEQKKTEEIRNTNK